MTDHAAYDEHALLLRVSEGDAAAFRQLYAGYGSLLYHFLREHTGDTSAADDLVQDIFTQVWITRESLTDIRNFRTFLFVLARNAALNAIKKKISDRKKERNYVERTNAMANDTDEQKEAGLSLIDQAVAQLPPQQQQVWIMSRRDGLKYAEIAGRMQLSRESVKKYLQYATAAIIKYVQQHLDLLLLFIAVTKIS